jgi:hypothetical protein
MAKQLFISYSRKDQKFARRLVDDLSRLGIDTWFDQRDIEPSERWDTAVQNALQESDYFLVVISKNSVASDNVLDEVAYALGEDKRVYPVLIEDCEIPFRLRRVQHVDFRGNFQSGLNELEKWLEPELKSQDLPQRPYPERKVDARPPVQPMWRRLPGWTWALGGGLVVVIIVYLIYSGAKPPGSIPTITVTAAQAGASSTSNALDPTDTPTPSKTSTPTPTPTGPPTEQVEFPAGCIPQETWLPYPSGSLAAPQDGCWSLPASWGISASGNDLSIFQQEIASEISHGLVRAIPDQSNATLTLNLRIEQMDMPSEQIHDVSFGVVPLSPESQIENGLFLQKERADFPILMKSTIFGDTYLKSASGERIEYTINDEAAVELVVNGNALDIFVDGERVVGPLAIPPSNRGFWIGYFMRTRGSLKVDLTDLTVEN